MCSLGSQKPKLLGELVPPAFIHQTTLNITKAYFVVDQSITEEMFESNFKKIRLKITTSRA